MISDRVTFSNAQGDAQGLERKRARDGSANATGAHASMPSPTFESTERPTKAPRTDQAPTTTTDTEEKEESDDDDDGKFHILTRYSHGNRQLGRRPVASTWPPDFPSHYTPQTYIVALYIANTWVSFDTHLLRISDIRIASYAFFSQVFN